MDPASTVLAFVTAGVQVIKLVKKTLNDIRNAPKKLQALHERVADIEISLGELQRRQLEGLVQSEDDIETLERISRRAETCLDGISAFTAKMQRVTRDGDVMVDKLRWLMKGSQLKDLSSRLDRLDSTLSILVNLVMS